MPRIIMQVIKDEYQLYKKTGKESGFGEYMNTKYNLNNVELLKELDNNMAMLRILKDYVMEKE
jgi:hypothetical protein|tara:strand:- start:1909 stop:2097 length:189 start_codon:yes stop_codon:yes gene_type:complete